MNKDRQREELAKLEGWRFVTLRQLTAEGKYKPAEHTNLDLVASVTPAGTIVCSHSVLSLYACPNYLDCFGSILKLAQKLKHVAVIWPETAPAGIAECILRANGKWEASTDDTPVSDLTITATPKTDAARREAQDRYHRMYPDSQLYPVDDRHMAELELALARMRKAAEWLSNSVYRQVVINPAASLPADAMQMVNLALAQVRSELKP